MILRDAKFCASYAASIEHFEFLMKRLGYDFKKNEYLTVKMPGRRLYHKLEKMDEMFTQEQFGYAMKYSYKMIPYYYSKNPIYYKRPNMTPFQKKYYLKIYRLRMIEQKDFMSVLLNMPKICVSFSDYNMSIYLYVRIILKLLKGCWIITQSRKNSGMKSSLGRRKYTK
jgi:hypothetical protein